MAEKKSKSKKGSPLGQGLASLLGPDVPVVPTKSATANLKQKLDKKAATISDPATPNQHPQKADDKHAPTTYLAIDQLRPGKFQPRRQFDAEGIKELADSIKSQGVLQPVIVRNVSGDDNNPSFEIVAGERRWRAAQQAALHEIPVLVRDFDDQTTLQLSILENVQRQDLTALEEAEGYDRLMQEFGHTQEDLSKIMGKSRSHIANTLRLLAMPENIRVALELGHITPGHARALSTANDPAALLEQVIAKKMSVRVTELLAKKVGKDGADLPKAKPTKDVDTIALERSLEERLGLKVEINGKGEKGTLSIRYKTLEQLDQILGRLR